VQLPLHVAWSGQTAFDLDRPKPRMHLYRIVLAEGQLADVTTCLNRDLLVSQWPVLRTLISKTVREVWESAFPELREGQPTAGRHLRWCRRQLEATFVPVPGIAGKGSWPLRR